MKARQTILVTRPEPGASETAARLKALGHDPIIAPFLEIIPRSTALPKHVTACVVTSSNSLWALPQMMRIFAVGDATARRAQQMTIASVLSAGADANALASLVRNNLDPSEGTLLLLSGQNQGLTLANQLRSDGFKVIRRAVYRSKGVRRFPSAARQAIKQSQVDSALFFSSETAIAFIQLCPASLYPLMSKVRALALSPAIAKVLESMPWCSIEVAEHPSQEALLKLI